MSTRGARWLLRGGLVVPFVVALVVMAGKGWTPVLDLAMTEFRVRDVGTSHTPLIGLPGRIGNFPDQGSHPGPLSFYLLAPVYRLFGESAFGLLAGAAVVNVAAAWTSLEIGRRLGGRRTEAAVAAVVCVATSWYGASILTQPWNPYLPLMPFLLVLLASWAVALGRHRWLAVQVVAASLCAQTHVPYLTMSVALVVLALALVLWRWWRQRPERGPFPRPVVLAVAVGAAAWLPVFVDQWRREPGNITMLRRHFLDPPETPRGLGEGLKVVLRHFDLLRIVEGLAYRPGDALEGLDQRAGGSAWVGALVLLAWLGSVVCWPRVRDRRLAWLHGLTGVVTVIGLFSTARIFGKVWYYLTLWAWLFALLAAVAVVWTVVLLLGDRAERLPLARVGWVVSALALVSLTVDAARVAPPEDRLGDTLSAVVEPTAQALSDGVGSATGPDGTYVVVWNDAYYFGSQGYGFVNELEKLGLTVRGTPTFRVPLTAHRVMPPAEATAEVVLATGVHIDRWSDMPGAVLVTTFDPRSNAETEEFERLRIEVLDLLSAADRRELVALVDENLFGLSVIEDLPSGVAERVARLLQLGQTTAVFIAPAGSFDAQG